MPFEDKQYSDKQVNVFGLLFVFVVLGYQAYISVSRLSDCLMLSNVFIKYLV